MRPENERLDADNVCARGALTIDFVKSDANCLSYVKQIQDSGLVYDRFNLILFELKQNEIDAIAYENFNNTFMSLNAGEFYAFGNNIVSNPFIKVSKGKKMFENIVKKSGSLMSEKQLVAELIEMMKDNTVNFPDRAIQNQSDLPDFTLENYSRLFITPEVECGTRQV